MKYNCCGFDALKWKNQKFDFSKNAPFLAINKLRLSRIETSVVSFAAN